jgi:hypothetical protein
VDIILRREEGVCRAIEPHCKKKFNVFRRANNRAQHAYISVRIDLTQASQDGQSSWWSERGPRTERFISQGSSFTAENWVAGDGSDAVERIPLNQGAGVGVSRGSVVDFGGRSCGYG